MDHNLLNKYWDGETTPQEEQQLIEYMSGQTGPESVYFKMLADARRQQSRLTVEDITRHNQKHVHMPSRTPVRMLKRWVASAAAILVFVLAGIGLWQYSRQITQPAQLAETYEDPYEAYEEIRQALAFVSAKLNKPQQEAFENIKKAGEYAEMFK